MMGEEADTGWRADEINLMIAKKFLDQSLNNIKYNYDIVLHEYTIHSKMIVGTFFSLVAKRRN